MGKNHLHTRNEVRPCQSRGKNGNKGSGSERQETLKETFLRKLLEKLIQPCFRLKISVCIGQAMKATVSCKENSIILIDLNKELISYGDVS